MAEEVEFYRETEFKDTDIEKIPKGWSVSRIGGLVEVETGKRAKGGGLNEGTVASIGGEHIDNLGRIIWNEMKFIPNDFYDLLSQGKVKLGDILLVKDGATTGKVAMIKNLRYDKVAVNEHVFVLRSKTELLINDFLFYFLFSKFGQAQIKKRFHGIIGGITKDDLENCLLPMPPLNEQRKISEVLSTVDESIQKTDDIIAKTERLKKGLMQELLTKGIGHKEFKDTEIGRIPKDWKVVKLEEITTKIKDIDHKMPKKQKIGIPFVSIKCMLKYPDFNFYLDPNDPDLEFISKEEYEYHVQRFDVERGDIIYSRFGSIGNAKLVTTEQPFIASYSIVLIKPNRHKVNLTLLTYILNSETVRKQAKIATKGATNRNLHLKDIKNLRVPLLSLFEQQKIAEILSTVDEKLEILQQEKAKLERIKRWFMEELLTGRIRVRIA